MTVVCNRALEAMQEFVDRVDKGEVRSTYTYNKFKDILVSANKEPPRDIVKKEDLASIYLHPDELPEEALEVYQNHPYASQTVIEESPVIEFLIVNPEIAKELLE